MNKSAGCVSPVPGEAWGRQVGVIYASFAPGLQGRRVGYLSGSRLPSLMLPLLCWLLPSPAAHPWSQSLASVSCPSGDLNSDHSQYLHTDPFCDSQTQCDHKSPPTLPACSSQTREPSPQEVCVEALQTSWLPFFSLSSPSQILSA